MIRGRRLAVMLASGALLGSTFVSSGPALAVSVDTDRRTTTNPDTRALECRLRVKRPKVVYVMGMPQYIKARARVKCPGRADATRVMVGLQKPNGIVLKWSKDKKRQKSHLGVSVEWSKRRGCRTLRSFAQGEAWNGSGVSDWNDAKRTRKHRVCL